VSSVKTALTVAGSDPSGGAGIQADLKTFSRLRVYGMSVITSITAQNTSAVAGIMEVPPEFVERQLDAVLSEIRVDAAKTGMLLTAGNIEVVTQKLREYEIRKLVVDPVMISTSGAALLNPDAIAALRRMLLPLALVITPNTDEAQMLTGKKIVNLEDMEEAALRIHETGARSVLIKGGHMTGSDAIDVLFDGSDFTHLRRGRIRSGHIHGTGCVLSAAITAELAAGKSLSEAVPAAKDFVTAAIAHAVTPGKATGICDPLELEN